MQSYTDLHRRVSPSVVSIYVRRDEPGPAAGSGFVYDADGHVVTNQHVVGTADEADVRFSDGTWTTGRVVGRDAHTDLAVLHVPDVAPDADPLPLATDPPEPGQPVAAFGNPLGLDGTVTTGIVSGTNRSSPSGNGFSIPDTVQTDAAINPGNSGGPLVTTNGEVVGVNRAKRGDNIGFAVSAAVVERVVPDLVSDGAYRHPFLRIATVDVSPAVAEANGLDDTDGVLVVAVRDGPAHGALVGCRGETELRGRRVPVGGDVIVGVAGERVHSHEELMRHLLIETRPGEPVDVAVVRDGRDVTETLVLGERPTTDSNRSRNVPVR